MASTLLLDRTLWDLVADSEGNIAAASGPYASIQDVSSQARAFRGEVYYDTTQGLPYLISARGQQTILGELPPAQFMKAQYVQAAKMIGTVTGAVVFFSALSKRELHGQIQVALTDGSTQIVGL